jgi:TonB family protein
MNMKENLAVLSVLLFLGSFRLLAQDSTNQGETGQDSIVTKTYILHVRPNPNFHDTTGAPPDFVKVDKQPKVIFIQKPEYPPVARRDSTEGRTWVKIWVGRDGIPKKAVLLKSSDDIFNLPSLDAAMTCKFTPAILDGKPVDVWVVIPFTFDKRAYLGSRADTLSEATRKLNEMADDLEPSSRLMRTPTIDSISYASAVSGYMKALRIYEDYRDWPESYSRYAKSLLRTAEGDLQMEKNSMVGHK